MTSVDWGDKRSNFHYPASKSETGQTKSWDWSDNFAGFGILSEEKRPQEAEQMRGTSSNNSWHGGRRWLTLFLQNIFLLVARRGREKYLAEQWLGWPGSFLDNSPGWLAVLRQKIPPDTTRLGFLPGIYMRMNYLIFWTILKWLHTENWHLVTFCGGDVLLRAVSGPW